MKKEIECFEVDVMTDIWGVTRPFRFINSLDGVQIDVKDLS